MSACTTFAISTAMPFTPPSRIHRHHLLQIVVEMLLHTRHEHRGPGHHVNALIQRVVALRHVVRPPEAEEHRAEIVLQRARLGFGNDVRLDPIGFSDSY